MKFCVDGLEDLMNNLFKFPIEDQKYVAEELLRSLEEEGYRCEWRFPNLVAEKSWRL